jgi:hypothetical protein
MVDTQPFETAAKTTDGLLALGAVLGRLDFERLHRPGRLRENRCAENSHAPVRRRKQHQRRFKSQASAQMFLTTFAAIYDTFNTQRHLIRRPSSPLPLEADAARAVAVARFQAGSGRFGLGAVNLSAPQVPLVATPPAFQSQRDQQHRGREDRQLAAGRRRSGHIVPVHDQFRRVATSTRMAPDHDAGFSFVDRSKSERKSTTTEF